MKRPSFLQGVLVALVLSFFGSALFAALAPVFGGVTVLRLLIALLGLAYVLYLISRSTARVGRLLTLALWLSGSALTWLLAPPLAVYALLHVGMASLIRSLYLYASVLSALLDLGLCALSVTAAVGTMAHSGSLFLALWCFFLVQALFSIIPASLKAAGARCEVAAEEPFDRAQRAAEAALRRIYATE